MDIDHRAASWVIHQNSGQLKHTCSAKEADEAIRVGFRVENQYPAPDAMAVARAVREACRASIDNPMNRTNPEAVRRAIDNIDLAQVVGAIGPVSMAEGSPAAAMDTLARACNLARIGYTDYLRIKAYMPVHAAPVAIGGEGGHDAIADYMRRASLTPSIMADTMDHAQLAALGHHQQGGHA
jgi:hypothetical protein